MPDSIIHTVRFPGHPRLGLGYDVLYRQLLPTETVAADHFIQWTPNEWTRLHPKSILVGTPAGGHHTTSRVPLVFGAPIAIGS